MHYRAERTSRSASSDKTLLACSLILALQAIVVPVCAELKASSAKNKYPAFASHAKTQSQLDSAASPLFKMADDLRRNVAQAAGIVLRMDKEAEREALRVPIAASFIRQIRLQFTAKPSVKQLGGLYPRLAAAWQNITTAMRELSQWPSTCGDLKEISRWNKALSGSKRFTGAVAEVRRIREDALRVGKSMDVGLQTASKTLWGRNEKNAALELDRYRQGVVRGFDGIVVALAKGPKANKMPAQWLPTGCSGLGNNKTPASLDKRAPVSLEKKSPTAVGGGIGGPASIPASTSQSIAYAAGNASSHNLFGRGGGIGAPAPNLVPAALAVNSQKSILGPKIALAAEAAPSSEGCYCTYMHESKEGTRIFDFLQKNNVGRVYDNSVQGHTLGKYDPTQDRILLNPILQKRPPIEVAQQIAHEGLHAEHAHNRRLTDSIEEEEEAAFEGWRVYYEMTKGDPKSRLPKINEKEIGYDQFIKAVKAGKLENVNNVVIKNYKSSTPYLKTARDYWTKHPSSNGDEQLAIMEILANATKGHADQQKLERKWIKDHQKEFRAIYR